jgi:phosphotransferase system IIB component
VIVRFEALGGAENLTSVNACTTRLRLQVATQSRADAAALTGLGVRGLVRPTADALRVVVGTVADLLPPEIRAALAAGPAPRRLRPCPRCRRSRGSTVPRRPGEGMPRRFWARSAVRLTYAASRLRPAAYC